MKIWSALALCLALSACSGGDTGNPLDGMVPGVYFGVAAGSGSMSTGIVAADGTTFLLNGDGSVVRAAISGPAASIGGAAQRYEQVFSNAYIQHFNVMADGSVMGALMDDVLSIDLAVGSVTDTIDFTPQTAINLIPASMALIAGMWRGEDGAAFVSLTIDANGVIATGSSSGPACTYRGSVALLRPDLNIYNLVLDLGCPGEPVEKLSGVIVRLPATSGPSATPEGIVLVLGDGDASAVATLNRQ